MYNDDQTTDGPRDRDVEILTFVTDNYDHEFFYTNDPESARRRLLAIGLTETQLQQKISGGLITRSGMAAFDAPGVCHNVDTVMAKHAAGALSLTGICGRIFGLDSTQHHRGHTFGEVGIAVIAIGPGFQTLKQTLFRSTTFARIEPDAVACGRSMWTELKLVASQVSLETRGGPDFSVRHISPKGDSGWLRIATHT